MSEADTGPESRWRGRMPLILVGGLVVIGFGFLCLFSYLILCQQTGFCLRPAGDQMTATPSPFPTTDAVAAVDDMPLAVQVGAGAPVSVTLSTPTALDINGTVFQVRSESVSGSAWRPALPQDRDDVAVWLRGTVVNYVLFISDTADNRALVQALQPGDPMALAVNGESLNFELAERLVVGQNNVELFRQTTPGLTLVLVNTDPGDRIVARGLYAASDALEPASPGDDQPAAIGETLSLESLRLTVTGATQLFDRAEAPAGFEFYLVDLRLENAGSAPLSLDRLSFALRDSFGNQYVVNPLASTLGNFPPVGGALDGGATRQATVGFQIPSGLSAPALQFSADDASTGTTVAVNIPYDGGDAAAVGAAVALLSADVTEDGTGLLLSGQIANSGTGTLIVEAADVTLIDQGTVHLLLSNNPAFPWIVGPGQTVAYSVLFQRPVNSSQAVFSILNQSFQLTGLR